MLAQGEDGIDRLHDVRRRAEGGVEADRLEGEFSRLDPLGERASLLAERGRCRSLKPVDRLLLVADDEDGARLHAEIAAAGELLGELAQDRPLRLAGVLRLVEQDVVDAGVELVKHPGRLDPLQQRACARDQVVIVEQRAQALLALIGGEHPRHQQRQRCAAITNGDGIQPLARSQHQCRKRLQGGERRTVQLGFPLAANVGVDRALSGDQAAAAEGDRVAIVLPRQQRAEIGSAGLARRAAGAERLDQPGKTGKRRQLGAKSGLDRAGVEIGRDAEEGGDTGAHSFGITGATVLVAEQGALAQRLLHHGLEGILRRQPCQQVERPGFGTLRVGGDESEQFTPRLAQHLGLGQIVRDLEARRHIGLERGSLQYARAEGVDRLDPEAARRLERFREKAAGLRLLGQGRRPAGQLRQRAAQALGVERRPVAERLEDAVRHVGGGRLGIGDAEHPAGRDAVQQEPQHAVDQHMGLARASVGRDPGGEAGVGGQRLALIGQRRDDPARLHGSTPSSPPPGAADHSLTRARWS